MVGPGRGSRACSRAASARTRRAPCSCRGAGPGPGPRSGSSASARRTCSRSPAGTGASRSWSRRTASASPTSSTCRPCARSWAGSQRRELTVHSVETARASAFASSLLFDYVAAYMYEGDAPMAERRAQALTLDRDLLRELLGQEELRELLDPAALADLELSLQALVGRAAGEDGRPGPRPAAAARATSAPDEAGARTVGGRVEASLHLAELASSRRAVRARIAGEERWIAMEDVARYRDGVGVSAPPGVPEAFLAPVVGALDGLLARYARTHGPFLARRAGAALGAARRRRGRRAPPAGRGRDAARRRVPAGRGGARVLRPGGAPAPAPAVARDAPARGGARRSRDAGAVPARVAGRRAVAVGDGECRLTVPRPGRARAPRGGRRPARRPADPGVGPGARRAAGPRPRLPAAAARRAGRDGRGRLGGAGEPRPRRRARRAPAARAASRCARPARPTASSARPPTSTSGSGPTSGAAAPASTASCSRRPAARSDREALDALWDLVWAGEVTNDTFAPLRALRWKRPAKDHRPRPGRLTALGPARGRRPLVAGGGRRRRGRRDRARRARSASTPRRWPCSSATGC